MTDAAEPAGFSSGSAGSNMASALARAAILIMAGSAALSWVLTVACGAPASFNYERTMRNVVGVGDAVFLDLPWVLPCLVGALLSLVVADRSSPDQRWMRLHAPTAIAGASIVTFALVAAHCVDHPDDLGHLFPVGLVCFILVGVAYLATVTTVASRDERLRAASTVHTRSQRTKALVERAGASAPADSEGARRSVRALLWRLTWGICAVTAGSILLAMLILVSTVWFAGASLTGYIFSLALFSIAALWGVFSTISVWSGWLHSDGEAADRLAFWVEIAYLGGVPLAVLIIVASSSSGGWMFVAPIAVAVTAPVLVTVVKCRVRPLRLIRDPYLQLVEAAAEIRSATARRTMTDLQAPFGPISVREWALRQRR